MSNKIEVDQYATRKEDGEDLWEISNLTYEDLCEIGLVLSESNISDTSNIRLINLLHSIHVAINTYYSSLDTRRVS